MKIIRSLLTLSAVVLLVLSVAMGCGRTETAEARADSLRPALLDGLTQYADRSGEDAYAACAELLSNPYEDNSRRELAELLREAWGVTDRSGLQTRLKALLHSRSPHKAWDYARGVNLSWMGCALGWMSHDEMKGYQEQLMHCAQENYADWQAYYADFLAGRAAWDQNDEVGDRKLSELLVREMLHHPASIYRAVSLQ